MVGPFNRVAMRSTSVFLTLQYAASSSNSSLRPWAHRACARPWLWHGSNRHPQHGQALAWHQWRPRHVRVRVGAPTNVWRGSGWLPTERCVARSCVVQPIGGDDNRRLLESEVRAMPMPCSEGCLVMRPPARRALPYLAPRPTVVLARC